MTQAEIYDELTELFRDFFADDGVVLKSETVAADIEGWDSLNHLSLMVAVERRFAVKFRDSEMESLGNIGELVAAIASKTRRPQGGR